MIVLGAVVGSGLGALARYAIAGAVQRQIPGSRPTGTAVVNVVGALVLGLVTGLYLSGRFSLDVVTIIGAGFCGGFTTFSTWMVESVQLGEDGGIEGVLALAVNVGLLLVVGWAGAAVGLSVS